VTFCVTFCVTFSPCLPQPLRLTHHFVQRSIVNLLVYLL